MVAVVTPALKNADPDLKGFDYRAVHREALVPVAGGTGFKDYARLRDTLDALLAGGTTRRAFRVPAVAARVAVSVCLVISADVRATVVADLQPVGRDAVMANFRRVVSVNFHTYQSGRLKVSESGDTLMAVLPTGVYTFPIKAHVKAAGGPKIKVVETDPPKKKD